MAFAASGLNCIAVGPQKLYIYSTTDSLTSATLLTNFNSTDCPGLLAGDIIIVAHNTAALLNVIRIASIDATSCTFAVSSNP